MRDTSLSHWFFYVSALVRNRISWTPCCLEREQKYCMLKGQATENVISDLTVSPNAAKLKNYGQQSLM